MKKLKEETKESDFPVLANFKSKKKVKKFSIPGIQNLGIKLKNFYVAQSTRQFGSIFSINCVTINDKMDFTLFFVSPIISEITANKFANSFYNQIKNC